MKSKCVCHIRNTRFGYLPKEQQQVFLKCSQKLLSFADLYIRLLGIPDVTQHVRFRYVSRLLKIRSINRSKHVFIDIGCGYGLFSTWLASRGIQVIGVDIASDKIKFAKKTSKILDIQDRSSYIVASACNLPFKENSFDNSICLDVMEHIPNDLDAFSEIRRTLKTGGVLILTTPCLLQRFRSNSAIELCKQWGHVRKGYFFGYLKRILKERHMEIVASFYWLKFFAAKVFDFYFRFFWERYSRVQMMLCAMFFPLMYTISLFDEIFLRESQGNEFALKIVKVDDCI